MQFQFRTYTFYIGFVHHNIPGPKTASGKFPKGRYTKAYLKMLRDNGSKMVVAQYKEDVSRSDMYVKEEGRRRSLENLLDSFSYEMNAEHNHHDMREFRAAAWDAYHGRFYKKPKQIAAS